MIFMEYKYSDALLQYGQKLALERLADNSQKAGKQSVVLVCEHDVFDCDSDIIADKAIVREFYYCRRWYHDGATIVVDKIRSFLNFVNQQYL